MSPRWPWRWRLRSPPAGRTWCSLDAHELAPSVAGRLGLGLEPNLRSAIDACAHGLGELPATITWPPGGAAALGVVAGFPSPVAATQVTPDDVLDVVDAVRERHACVVDADETSPGRVGAARRGDGHRRCGGRQPGRGRARARVDAALVRRRVPATPVHLAVNRAPGARYRREEIRAEIVRTLRPESITWLPTDARVEAAAWDGALVGRGPFRAAVASLAHEVTCRSAATRSGEDGMSTDAYDVIRRDVHARIERRRLRPEADLDEVRAEVGRAVDDYQRVALLGEELPLVEPAEMADRVLRSITDFGALTELIARRDVEEIFIEGARVSYLDGSGRLRGLTVPTSEDENRQVVERLLAATDRQLNTKHPMVQARVLGGTARLTAAIPPVGDQLSATAAALRGAQRDARRPGRARLAVAEGGGVPPRC